MRLPEIEPRFFEYPVNIGVPIPTTLSRLHIKTTVHETKIFDFTDLSVDLNQHSRRFYDRRRTVVLVPVGKLITKLIDSNVK